MVENNSTLLYILAGALVIIILVSLGRSTQNSTSVIVPSGPGLGPGRGPGRGPSHGPHRPPPHR